MGILSNFENCTKCVDMTYGKYHLGTIISLKINIINLFTNQSPNMYMICMVILDLSRN